MERRQFLRLGATMAASAVLGSSTWRRALAAGDPATGGPGPYGPLLAPDANGLMLPAGFTSRVIARGGERVAGTSHVWHPLADGGATYRVRSDWIYVSNSESIPGGVGAIRFDRNGAILAAYTICSGTILNCAGGSTPWRTWLTCEEHDSGHVFECDPTGVASPIKRAALGTFKHEAAAVDPHRRRIYLTEDQSDGRFYRFTPERWPRLDAGRLEVAIADGAGSVRWASVPEPNPVLPLGTPTRHQVPESTAFDGGEGIVYRRRHVFFTTKGDDRVWDYEPARERLSVLYEAGLDPAAQLSGVDNITTSRVGDLIVAEDGGNMELVLITPDRSVSPLVRVIGQDQSELTGPAFDPRGRRLHFSSQRGDGLGITYEVSGPFRSTAPPVR